MTTVDYVAILLLSLLSCLTTAFGVILALWLQKNDRAIAIGIGFSAGIMIILSVAELIPEAAAKTGFSGALISVLSGLILLWLIHKLLPHTHLIKEKGWINQNAVKSVYLVIIGLILHDVPEGFALANAYQSDRELGILVAIGIALHNLPEEFALAIPVVTLKSNRLLFKAALLSALAEPFGALIGIIAIKITPFLSPYFLSFAAGAMIFVSIHELVPFARRFGTAWNFISGFIISWIVYHLLEMWIIS